MNEMKLRHKRRSRPNQSAYRIHFLPPGLCDVLRFAGAVDLWHVPRADPRGAHGHEVRSRAADGELGKVGERLAGACAEQKGSHNLVERSYVLVKA